MNSITPRTQNGFTLIELIMVIVFLGIVAGLGVPMLLGTTDAWILGSSVQNEAVMEAMAAVNRMSREMRNLKNDSSVTTANAATFSFTGTDDVGLSYSLNGDILTRTSVVTGADGLADNVTALTFTYYDDAGAEITTPLVSPNLTDIRGILVDFTINAGGQGRNFQFRVYPRNLRRFNEKFN